MGSQSSRIAIATGLALSGATVVTANTRAARRLRLEAETRALQGKSVCEAPDILPLDAWVNRTWTDCLLAGVVDRALLRPNVTTALWEQIVARSDDGRQLMSHHATAQLAQEARRLIHVYRIPCTRSLYAGMTESKAFYGWMEAFDARCGQEKWIDLPAALTLLIPLAGKIPNRPQRLVAFGFDRFTPIEEALWNALREAGTEVEPLLPETSSDFERARSLALRDSEEELRTAALWARRKLEENTRASIGIITPGLRTLREKIETIFDECLHPENRLLANPRSATCFEISLGRPLDEHPIVRCATRLLRLATSGIPTEEFSSLLRSRYLEAGTSEAAQRARLDVRLRKKLRSTVTLAGVLNEIDNCATIAPKFRGILKKVQHSAQKLPQRISRTGWATEARRLLTTAGWPGDGAEDLTLTSQEFQVTTAWDDALSAFGALDQVLPTRPTAEIHRELEGVLSESTFAVENEAAPIQVVGPVAACGDSFDALWFCGATDEAWPQRGQPNPFIPFALQRQAGLPVSPEANLRVAELATARLLQSAEDCVFSWPKREEDRDLRPSPLLKRMTAIKADELLVSAIRDWQDIQRGAELEDVVDEQAPPLTNDQVQNHSTNLLQWQSGCPFRAFAQVRLAAEPLEHGTLGASPRERGKVTERALEYVWGQFRDLQNFQQLTPQQVEHEITVAIDQALNDKFPQGTDAWLQEHRAIERSRLNKLIHDWLDVDTKREPFRNVGHQQEIEFQIGELKIKGRADRIDQTTAGDFVIIDYKTGNSNYSPSLWDLPRPQDPQLPIYTIAQRAQGREIAGVGFARIRTGRCGFDGEAARKQVFFKLPNGRRVEEFAATIESWRPELEKLAEAFLTGNAEVDPKYGLGESKSTCKYCHLKSLCRISELAAPPDDDLEEIFDDE